MTRRVIVDIFLISLLGGVLFDGLVFALTQNGWATLWGAVGTFIMGILVMNGLMSPEDASKVKIP
jgi:hypothetical protein